jgi:hypothetical protein
VSHAALYVPRRDTGTVRDVPSPSLDGEKVGGRPRAERCPGPSRCPASDSLLYRFLRYLDRDLRLCYSRSWLAPTRLF